MKSLHLGLVLIFIVLVVICTKPVHADSDLIKILDVQVQPSTIKVNNTFSVSVTILNNSTYPVYLTSGSCVPAFSVEFDSHSKQVYQDIACTLEAIEQRVDPNVKTTISSVNKPGTIYKAIQAGTANANITIPYFIKNQTATDYSDIYYNTSKSFQFQIYDTTEPKIGNQLPIGTPFKSTLDLPLKQFKSGTPASDVKCNLGLWLVTKTEDGSPACVKPDTAYILIHRGWAKEVSQTSLYTMPTISSAPCDVPYPQSNTGVAVLYMSPNSTGKICATYHNPDSSTQSSTRVFAAKDEQQQASEIVISAYPDIIPTGNSTIMYTIKTGSQAGLYGMSFFCGSIPFAVGYDNQSGIILDDFPWLYKNDICLSQTNVFQITGLSGIHVQYVTKVHRG